ncbi:Zinc finger, C2CH-type [Cinara cedri]|uniref:Zinc finger, C2CH-type n=1 Tax=Cinara cedri TaxID=506608 RepID=A0A5E4MG36_9HEMI|nr:Zinc finger, C2CH-type [Cinara cedri]
MPSCLLCCRSKNARSKNEKITFHRYPKRPEILKKWIEFTKNYDDDRNMLENNITVNSVMCSAHFLPDSFYVYKRTTVLKPTATPCVTITRVRGGRLNYPEIIFVKDNMKNDTQTEKDDDNNANLKCSPHITDFSQDILEQVPNINGFSDELAVDIVETTPSKLYYNSSSAS